MINTSQANPSSPARFALLGPSTARIGTALALCLCLCLATPLEAGVVFEMETTDHKQPEPTTESIELVAEGRNLKMEIAPSQKGGSGGEMVFRGERREMVVVNHDDKSYMAMDEEAIKAIAGRVKQATSQIEQMLENVPEDRRAMVEQMMKQRMPDAAAPARAKAKVEKTSERAEHNGYPCVKYVASREGSKLYELWVTDWKNVEGGEDVAEVFEEMAEFYSGLLDSFGAAGGGPRSFDDNFFESMQELDGFPVVVREFGEDGSLEGESELRSARRRTLDPADFEPPAGYKRRQMPGF